MKYHLCVIVTGFFFLSSTTYAQNPYLGIGVGSASYSDNNLDDADTGFTIYVGTKVNEHIGLELSYTDFGKQEDKYTSVYTFEASVKATGLGFSAIGFVPISRNFILLGKVGVIALEADLTLGTNSESDDGYDLLYGLGAEYRFSKQFSVRGAWEFIALEKIDFDMLSINAQFSF
jgi:OOP family OmpA-OmpF porin